MRKSVLVFAVVVSLASSGLAQFEGVIDMKMSSKQGNGTIRVAVGKAGVRTEMKMGSQGMNIAMVTLVKAGEPDKAYQIDDAAKTFSVIDLKAARAKAAQAPEPKYTVQKLPPEKVRGYDCAHVLLIGSRGERTELWTTKEIGDYASFVRTLGGPSGLQPGFDRSLRDAGAEGFPVKSIHLAGKGESVTMELVSVSQKAPPASTFQVPSGYARRSGPMIPGGRPTMPKGGTTVSPDAMKAMREQMQTLPADQQQMMEKMMQQEGKER
jgi:hypothetical protein